MNSTHFLELIIEEPRKYFEKMSAKHKNRIIAKFKYVMEIIADILTKGNPYAILDHFVFKNPIEKKSYDSEKLENLLNGVREAYLNAPTRHERRLVLGAVSHVVTYRRLLDIIPELTEYEFTASRKELVRLQNGEEIQDKRITRFRLDPESINRFIEFITQ